jgi:hypothetical protein
MSAHTFLSLKLPKNIVLNVTLTPEKYNMEELDVDARLILKFIAIFM